MQFNDEVVGGITLIRPAIQSPDYLAGVRGWTINDDGSAEFNNVTIRGTVVASVFQTATTGRRITINESNSQAMRLYDSTGALMLSLGDQAGFITSFDPADASRSIGIGGAQIQFNSTHGGGLLTQVAALYNNAAAVLLNTQLAGGVAFDVTTAALAWVTPGSDVLETWHAPTFAANWLGTTTFNAQTGVKTLKYRRDTSDNLVICGAAVSSSTGTVVTVLPNTGYWPKERQMIPANYLIGTTVTPGFVQVTAAGQIACSAAVSGVTVAAGTQVYINGSVPLGNLS